MSGYTWAQATNVDITDVGVDTVQCKTGKVALGGGALPSGAGPNAVLAGSFPAFGEQGLTGWSFKFNNAAAGAKATLWVTCVNAA